jgi:hypothetical protein
MMVDPQERSVGNPRIEVFFAHQRRQYEPGDRLAVRYVVEGCEGEMIRVIEHSVVWYTEGKGEEDLGVHFFERITDRGAVASAGRDGAFETTLPASPLSYEGLIVKVRWCVRVRLFFASGRDFVSEHVFLVGRIPPARLPPRGA